MQLDASIAAVVTGGASGLGAATARRLAGHGVKVALFDVQRELGERSRPRSVASSARSM
jgi:NAD(P)-dependent dehydrogenase (short-subunit alcohol dehydrogenase family)